MSAPSRKKGLISPESKAGMNRPKWRTKTRIKEKSEKDGLQTERGAAKKLKERKRFVSFLKIVG